MDNILLPFLMSMLLGRTIDLTSYTIGSNIYDDADYVETPIKLLNSSYTVLQENVFPYIHFGLPIDIVLRIKTNFLSSSSGAMGLDGLLKDASWKYNTVIIPVTTMYTTKFRTLKNDSNLLSEWATRIPASQTHFVDSMYYGGWCLVLYKLKCDIPGDVEAVRRTLMATLGPVGEMGDHILAKWNKIEEALNLNEAIRGEVKLETQVYSTVPLSTEITSPESLLKAIVNFPKDVGDAGVPLYMNLKPLNPLDDKFISVEENHDVLPQLEKLDEMFDDVKVAKARLLRWVSETLEVFEDEDEEKISNLLHTVNECLKAFYKLGAEVTLYKKMDFKYLESAFQMYMNGLERGSDSFSMAYRRLKEDLDADCKDDFFHKIKGLLKVYDHEKIEKGKVTGGLEACKNLCYKNEKCRAIGYADRLISLDLATGLYLRKEHQCWIYFRSTSTATVNTPNGFSGDMGVYDRECY